MLIEKGSKIIFKTNAVVGINVRAKIETDDDFDLFSGDFINVTGCNYFIRDISKAEDNIYSIMLTYAEPKHFFRSKKRGMIK